MYDVTYDEIKEECLFCKSSNIGKMFKDYLKNDIWFCENCHVQFMNPQYTDEYLTRFYSGYIREGEGSRWDEPLLYGHDYYLSVIEKSMGEDVGDKFLLDFGCGGGFLMKAAGKRGWSVEGYDVDPVLTNKLGRSLSCKVYSGDFFSIDFEKRFNLITMHQVLEHLKDPVAYLGKIKTLLKPNGCVFIAVPNIKSLSNRFKFLMERLGLRKKRIGAYYDTDHHLSYFSIKSLSRILENNGFIIIGVRHCHKVYPGQSRVYRFLLRNCLNPVISNSAFFVIAKNSVVQDMSWK